VPDMPGEPDPPTPVNVNFAGVADAWGYSFGAGFGNYIGSSTGAGTGYFALPGAVSGTCAASASGGGLVWEEEDNPPPVSLNSQVNFTGDWSGGTYASVSISVSAAVIGRADATASASSG